MQSAMRDSSHLAPGHTPPVIASREPRPSRVVLVGFMGAGKSTVGPLLAALLGFTFYDADRFIELETGASVAGIFQAHGESGFRTLEADAISRLMRLQEIVLALGGGALETASTRSLIQNAPGTSTIYLHAPPETLLARCEQQPAPPQADSLPARPLLDELRNNPPRLREKLALREPHYRAAHLIIRTADLTPEQVADEILQLLQLNSKQEQTR